MASLALNPSLPPTPHRVVERTLKRSASTASLLSPPASVRKPRASKRLRSAVDSDDDSDTGHGSFLRRESTIPSRPKTRSAKGKAVAATASAPTVIQKRINFVETHNKHKEHDGDTADEDEFGPGPRPKTPPPRVCVPIVAPQTPPRTANRRGGRIVRDAPLRDSPNNPFLVECPESPVLRPPRPKRRAADFTEGPTVGYVFRGVPTTFANPYANQHPPSPTVNADHPSFLPLDHPDFSPSELTRPQLLFPEAHGFAREGESPCNRQPPSTPKRGRAKAPRTPVRKSKRKLDESAGAGPSTAQQEAEAEPPAPKTPEPKTPQKRTRARAMVVTTTTTIAADVGGSRRVMRTRSKTTAETHK